MLKFLLFAGLVLLVLYAFSIIGRRRPPGDWDRDNDQGGPVRPRIGVEPPVKSPRPDTPEKKPRPEPATTAPGGGAAGDDGGGD